MQRYTRTQFEALTGAMAGKDAVMVTYRGKDDFLVSPVAKDPDPTPEPQPEPEPPTEEPDPTPEPEPDPQPEDPSEPQITNGYQLNSSNCGVTPFLNAGGTLTPRNSQLYISSKTHKNGDVIEGLNITGGVVIDGLNVTLRNCYIKTSGVWPWGSSYAVTTKNDGRARLEFCTVEGGKSISIYGRFDLYRVEAKHGSDLFRLQGGSSAIECWGHDIWRAGEGAHSDVLQWTNNSDTIIQTEVRRCKFEAYGDDPYAGEDDFHNGAIQTGSFGTGGGVTGIVEDCYFDGGNYTVNAGGGAAGTNVDVVYKGNRFGLNHRYGPIKSTGGSVVFDSTNVWHETGTTHSENPKQVVADTPVK